MICPKCGAENKDNAKFCSECAAPLLAVVETVIEQSVYSETQLEELKTALNGKYEIIREIGRGGMGIVYECRELSLDRTVALKVLPRELTYDKQFVERFKSEIKILAKIEHPNIVPMISADEANGFIYFTMKFVKGRNLTTHIKEKGKLSSKEAVEITLQIARALSCAHDANVLHRDLKPENIMIDDRGHVYVMDFGIARVLDGTRMTRTGSTMGTPEYMSPEQCSGSSDPDIRSDIYSLGAVMYEMLCGTVPFRGEATAVMYQHVNVEPAPIEKLVSGLPVYVINLVNSCLAKKPDKRPQSAAEIISSLQKSDDRNIKAGTLPFFQNNILYALISRVNIFRINKPVLIVLLLVLLMTPYFLLYAIQRWNWDLSLADYIPVFYIKIYDTTYKRSNIGHIYYSRCEKNYREERYYDAIDDCTKAIDLGYGQVYNEEVYFASRRIVYDSTYYTRALAKAETNDYDGAINDLSFAIKNSPNSETYYIKRAVVKCKKGDYDSALVDLNLALKINPRNPEIYTGMAFFKYSLKDIDGSISYTTTAIDVAIDNLLSMLSMKYDDYKFDDIYINQSQYYEIKSYLNNKKFDSFIALYHEKSQNSNNRKNVYNKLKVLQEACSIRAKYKYEKADFTGALNDCEIVLSINEEYSHRGLERYMFNDSEMYFLRGKIKSDKGDYAGAIIDYTRSIDINPGNAEVYKKRGEAKKQKGDDAGSKVDFDTWEKLK